MLRLGETVLKAVFPAAHAEHMGHVSRRRSVGTSAVDLPTGPKEPRSTVLSPEEEAIAAIFRRPHPVRWTTAFMPRNRRSHMQCACHCIAVFNAIASPARRTTVSSSPTAPLQICAPAYLRSGLQRERHEHRLTGMKHPGTNGQGRAGEPRRQGRDRQTFPLRRARPATPAPSGFLCIRSTDRRYRPGTPVKNLAHSASIHSDQKRPPSNRGIKHIRAEQAGFGIYSSGSFSSSG